MSIRQGAVWAQTFTLKSKSTGLPINISTWQFSANIQVTINSPELTTLTSANGGFSIVDGPNGRFEIMLTATQTQALPLGRVVFDVIRTDAVPGPVYLFSCSAKVKGLT